MNIYSSANVGDIPVNSDSSYYYYQDVLTGEVYAVPKAASQNALPPFVSGNTSTTGSSGGYIQSGQSWLNDLLNFGLGLAAIGNRGTIQGGAINPAQQPQTLGLSPLQQQALFASQQANAGGQLGSSLQSFITKNSGWLLIGGAAFLLWKSGRK